MENSLPFRHQLSSLDGVATAVSELSLTESKTKSNDSMYDSEENMYNTNKTDDGIYKTGGITGNSGTKGRTRSKDSKRKKKTKGSQQTKNVDLQVEGDQDTSNLNKIDANDWKKWSKKNVIDWVFDVLKKNDFENNEIESFIQNTFKKLHVNGKVLLVLKKHESSLKDFEQKIQNVSFGISVVLMNEIKELK